MNRIRWLLVLLLRFYSSRWGCVGELSLSLSLSLSLCVCVCVYVCRSLGTLLILWYRVLSLVSTHIHTARRRCTGLIARDFVAEIGCQSCPSWRRECLSIAWSNSAVKQALQAIDTRLSWRQVGRDWDPIQQCNRLAQSLDFRSVGLPCWPLVSRSARIEIVETRRKHIVDWGTYVYNQMQLFGIDFRLCTRYSVSVSAVTVRLKSELRQYSTRSKLLSWEELLWSCSLFVHCSEINWKLFLVIV